MNSFCGYCFIYNRVIDIYGGVRYIKHLWKDCFVKVMNYVAFWFWKEVHLF